MKTYFFLLPDLSAGGAERVSITIARILKKQGLNVKFINLGFEDGEMRTWIEPEFELISLRCRRVLSSFFKLFDLLKNHPNSIIYSSREHLSIVGIIVAKRLGLPIIVRIPNMPNNKLAKTFFGVIKEKVIKILNRFLLPYAQTIIAQNEEMASQLQIFYRLSKDRIVVINNPIDKEYVLKSAENLDNPLPKNSVNYLNICNISYAKGIDILLKAFDIVKRALPQAHLTIVGRISTKYAMTIIESLKVSTDVSFVGFQSNPYPYMKHCDVFVLPSRMEGFPNVVLEAMCFNKPIASTTCVEVIKEIISPGLNGYYCDIEDAEALAQCMLDAVSLKNINNDYNLFDSNKLLSIFR